MKLSSPFTIGSRLLPCVVVGGAAISLDHDGITSDGRDRYRWYIDLADGSEFSENDLKSGVQGCTTQEMFGTLLAFLGAAAESYRYFISTGRAGENMDLFPPPVVEWAASCADELSIAELEIEENRLEMAIAEKEGREPQPLIEE